MICIYRESALESARGRKLSRKVEWSVTSAENLRNAIDACVHAPWVAHPGGQLVIEIDGVLYDRELLPTGKGKELLLRCRFWLYARQRVQNSATAQRPVFGL